MTATGGYFKIKKKEEKKVVFNLTVFFSFVYFLHYVNLNARCVTDCNSLHSARLNTFSYFFYIRLVLKLSSEPHVSYVPPPIQEETWL